MSTNDARLEDVTPIKAETTTQHGSFYGYTHHLDGAGRFLGEEKAGSKSFYVFSSKQAFEAAVSGYNVLGNPPVKSAAIGPA